MLSRRSRGWCFTANLPDGWEQFPPIEEANWEYEYLVYQYEKGTHPHIQGYVYFKNAIVGKSVAKRLYDWCGIHCHLEVAKGSPEQNKVYCTKEESRIVGYGPFEFGIMPEQGKRSDLSDCFNLFREEGLTDELLAKYPSQLVMYHGKMKQLKNEVEHREWKFTEERQPPQVIVIYGPTGTGKTREAHEAGKDKGGTVMCDYSSRYLWGQYEGQEVVCFDEFVGQVPIYQMLKLLDRYNNTVQVPYLGNKPWIPKTIYICSNLAPEQWWADVKPAVTLEQREALYRRFTKVIEWKYIVALDKYEKFYHKRN